MAYAQLSVFKSLIDETTDKRDTILQFWLDTGAQRIDKHCDRVFTVADGPSTRIFHGEDGSPYQIDDFTTMPTVVEYASTPAGPWTELPDGWWVEPLNPKPIHGSGDHRFPYEHIVTATDIPTPFVRVTTTFDWPVVPPDVIEANLLLGLRFNALPDAPLGSSAAQTEVGGPVYVRSVPDVMRLLRPYCKTAESLL